MCLGRRDATRPREAQKTGTRPATVQSSRYLGLHIPFQDAGDFGRVASQVDTVDVAWPRKRNREFLTNPSRIRGEQDDAVTQADGFTHVVGDKHDRFAMLAPDSLNIPVQLFACEGVQRPEWFIHQEDAGVRRQRPSQGHTLFHAAGQFVDIGMHEPLESDEFKKILGLLPALGRVQSIAELQAEEHVAQDGQPGKQRRFLKHHEAVWPGSDDGLSIGLDHAAIGSLEVRR